jgi:hypothetical protein
MLAYDLQNIARCIVRFEDLVNHQCPVFFERVFLKMRSGNGQYFSSQNSTINNKNIRKIMEV